MASKNEEKLKQYILENFKYENGNVYKFGKSCYRAQPKWFKVGNCLAPQGYFVLSFRYNNKKYKFYTHRIIWLLYYGYFPDHIDHIDRNKSNNNITNLRNCTDTQNKINVAPYSKSGYKGVTARYGRYRAQITTNKKTIHLGSFKTKKEAALAYNIAAIKYHGEKFAYLNDVSGDNND